VNTTPKQPNIIRSPISHELAFPVGYELLREHFGDLPHWSGARFRFSAHPTTFAADFTQILRASEPYCIFRVEHRPIERRGYDHVFAGWTFTTYPVPRDIKSLARVALCEGPFQTLHEFIAALPSLPHYYTRRDVLFDLSSRRCTTEPPFQR
jgi:hypothetical protein